MIETIITNYLRNNRRLVVPELGAFLKKEDEKIVFVTFLHKDDGILNSLVRDSYGVSQSDAASIIAEYGSNVRSCIVPEKGYSIPGIGVLRYDQNGIIFLDSSEIQPAQAVEIEPLPEPIPEPLPDPVKEPEPKPLSIFEPAPTTFGTKAIRAEPIPAAAPRRNPQPLQPTKSGKRADLILVIAVVVAVIAIVVMIYGYFVQDMPSITLK